MESTQQIPELTGEAMNVDAIEDAKLEPGEHRDELPVGLTNRHARDAATAITGRLQQGKKQCQGKRRS